MWFVAPINTPLPIRAMRQRPQHWQGKTLMPGPDMASATEQQKITVRTRYQIASEYSVEPKFTLVEKWMHYLLLYFVPVMREMPEI